MTTSPSTVGDTLIALSKQKWDWMAAREIENLDALVHDEAVFVHMGATFTKAQELDVIRSGAIEYRRADVHDTSVRVIGSTGIVLSTLDLLAVVGGDEVTNPFVVTEVFVEDAGRWVLASVSFTRLLAA